MSEDVTAKPRLEDSLKSARVKLVGLAASGMGLVAAVSADIDINGTVGPILDSVISLIPTIVALVIAMVPAVITLAVVGFIVGFLDKILGMMKL